MSNLMQILYSLALSEAYTETVTHNQKRYKLSSQKRAHRKEFICPSDAFDSLECKFASCANCPLSFGGMYSANEALENAITGRYKNTLLTLIVIGIGDELSNRIKAFCEMEHRE